MRAQSLTEINLLATVLCVNIGYPLKEAGFALGACP